MRRIPPAATIARVPAYTGATLTEVLMAIFIMSIGVVSVITLFPLAILRAVHATQLTNSKVLEDNVEEFINTNIWMLRGSPVDPKLDRDSPLPGNTDLANYVNSACVIDPLGEQFLPNYSTQFGNRGTATPPTWAIRRISPFQQFPAPIPSYLTTVTNSEWTNVERGWAETSVCALPDSWVAMGDDLPTDVTATEVIFPTDLGASSGQVRLLLISQDGTRSLTRMGTTTVSGDETTFTNNATEPDIPLPAFGIANVGRAVIEANESRYSWIITCPVPAAAPPAATCAVFFRRSFDPDEEFLYQNAGASPFEILPGPPQTPTATVTIDWGANDPVPLLREGNYVFDAEFAFWYRIRSYDADLAARTAIIEIDRPARAEGRGVIIPHGLVHVFDLELRGQE